MLATMAGFRRLEGIEVPGQLNKPTELVFRKMLSNNHNEASGLYPDKILKKPIDRIRPVVIHVTSRDTRTTSRIQPKPGFITRIFNKLDEYCDHTSLHGLRYVGEENRPLIERVFWIFAFSLALFTCIYLIQGVWKKWQRSPVIVSLGERPVPISDIPFPAVTICSTNKVRQSVFNYTYFVLNQSKDGVWDKRAAFSELACLSNWIRKDDESLTMSNVSYVDDQFLTFLHEAGQTLKGMIPICIWRSETVNCSEVFTPIVTEEGLCYVFNNLPPKAMYHGNVYKVLGHRPNWEDWTGWSPDYGYPEKCGFNATPRRALAGGPDLGLRLALDIQQHQMDPKCTGVNHGFTILLHNPVEFPLVSQQGFRMPLDMQLSVVAAPQMMITTKELKRMPPTLRLCYYSWERPLGYFKYYTQGNCETECITNYTLNRCQCVIFYMPRNETTSICGPEKMLCAKWAIREFREKVVSEELRSGSLSNDQFCHCLPSCTELKYTAVVSMSDIKVERLYNFDKSDNWNREGKNYGTLTVMFMDHQFIHNQRNEMFGLLDFLGNCGGLLGLCLGFSMLSLVEILYFATLRLLCDRRKKGRSVATSDFRVGKC